MKEWFLSSELVGLDGMPNSLTGVTQKAKRNNWLSRRSAGSSRALEYHISSFHPDIKRQLVAKYITDSDERMALLLMEEPTPEHHPFESEDEKNFLESIKDLDDKEYWEAIADKYPEPTWDDIYKELEERRLRNEENERNKKLSQGHNDVTTSSSKTQEETTEVVYYDIAASAGAGRLIEYVPSKRIELNETLRLALNIQVPSRAKL